MAAEKKRIGIILASIHTGMSRNMWSGFARAAAAENTSLFIFPGGRLNAHDDFEYLRNSVYYLANEENLDGCISWSSSIRCAQSHEEFEAFHFGFKSLPVVTLGFKSVGHPCVEFDAYSGMKALVSHFINVHGSQKIAFLRGPEFHRSAAARFEGYYDTLKEFGLPVSNPLYSGLLVTDPFNWNEGEAAAAQLFEQRSLIPGKDFDTLIGSSDLMTLGAINYFKRRGFRIPKDYYAAGFNNSAESQVTESSLTTVHLPYEEMSIKSFKILLGNMTRKKSKKDISLLLPCELIIRESCGCNGYALKMPNEYQKLEKEAAMARHETEKLNSCLNSLKCDLLGTRDRFSLVQNLACHLPNIGITVSAIVLYNDEKTSVFVGGFTHEGICSLKEHRFPSQLLVPHSLRQQFCDGIFMVQPLFIDNRSLGYFIHNVPIFDGVIFEELRSAVSYALKGIFLLEETITAKRVAEQAQRAKTEFLKVLEDSLFNPLQEMTERLELMEKKISNNEFDSLLDDIKSLKLFTSSKETEASSIMDFTLANVDELSLRKTVFDPGELLPNVITSSGIFPLLIGDVARLIQCFSVIMEQYEDCICSTEITYAGFAVSFRKKPKAKIKQKKHNDKARQFSLLLAERIILMHGGKFFADSDLCTVTLPWPTLTGCELSKNHISAKDHVLVLSDPEYLPANFLSLPKIYDIEKAQAGNIALITWNANGAACEDLVKVINLKNKSEFSGVPFLIFGLPSGAGG